MTTVEKTDELTANRRPFGNDAPLFGMLVAYAPKGATTVDRCVITPPFRVGRNADCPFQVREKKISGYHFEITRTADGHFIDDCGSTNGTFVNGRLLSHKQRLESGDVIRAGQSVFVFFSDARPVFETPPVDAGPLSGRFHVGPLIQSLKEAVRSHRHLLLAGPSGAGKELTARAIAGLLGTSDTPLHLLSHNAARFSSEEEAAATLFGVGTRVFSNVDPRPGLIETASGGLLFLDEVHNLPPRVQRSLLRVIEDGQVARIGDINSRACDVRFILASNAEGPTFALAPDLLARLRIVAVPSLAERVADIPTIFDHLFGIALQEQDIPPEPVLAILKGDHYESLCLDRFSTDNVRGLVDLADRIATRIGTGVSPERAIASIFAVRFDGGHVATRNGSRQSDRAGPSKAFPKDKPDADRVGASRYEANKPLIIAAYGECGGNLTALEQLLQARGIRCSRRWLAVFLGKWGIRS